MKIIIRNIHNDSTNDRRAQVLGLGVYTLLMFWDLRHLWIKMFRVRVVSGDVSCSFGDLGVRP